MIRILPIYYVYFVGELIAEGPSRNNGKSAAGLAFLALFDDPNGQKKARHP
jgi:hypothetical protein